MLTFRSCVLMVTYTNCSLSHSIINAISDDLGFNLILTNQSSVFELYYVNVISGKIGVHNVMKLDIVRPVFSANIKILKSNFQGTSINVSSLRIGLTHLHMKQVVIEEFRNSVMVPVLYVYSVYFVYLADTTFQNNAAPLIKLDYCQVVEFSGDCKFLNNSGDWGITISSASFSYFAPFSKHQYYNNTFTLSVFRIDVIIEKFDISSSLIH